MTKITPAERRAAILAIHAVGEAIEGLGSVPAGELYARVMGHMSLSTFEGIVKMLVDAGLVTRSNHLLTWVGPRVSNR